MALDVLRAMAREPEGLPAFLAECEPARGADARLDAHLDTLPRHAGRRWQRGRRSGRPAASSRTSRWPSRRRCSCARAPPAVADAFCAGRLGEARGRAFGTLPRGVDAAAVAGARAAISAPDRRPTDIATRADAGRAAHLGGDGSPLLDADVGPRARLGRVLPVHQARPRGPRAGVPGLRPAGARRRSCWSPLAARARRACAAARARRRAAGRRWPRCRSSSRSLLITYGEQHIASVADRHPGGHRADLHRAARDRAGFGGERGCGWSAGRRAASGSSASALLFGVDLTGSLEQAARRR